MASSRIALLISFFSAAVFISAAVHGLSVGPVSLVDRRYITYSLKDDANNSVIMCNHELEGEERLSRVFWKFYDDEKQVVGEYEWSPRTGGNATGELEGVVNMTRGDGALELTELRYNLSGEYSCGVVVDTNQREESEPWEVLIVDIIGSSHLSSYYSGCSIIESYKSATVFPGPTLRAGMMSTSLGGFIKEVSSMEWLKHIYSNGSIAYSFENFNYTVDNNTPEDAYFIVHMGVTKTNGDYISLGGITSNSSAWREPGCPDVGEVENSSVYYFPGDSRTCRGGRRATTRATITCNKGYTADGNVTMVVLRCQKDSLMWAPEDGHTATEDQLVCAKDPDTPDTGNGDTALLASCSILVSCLLLNLLQSIS